MSFARFSDTSDLYVYQSRSDYICCACCLTASDSGWSCETAEQMIEHVQQHQEAGHLVSVHTLPSLELAAYEDSVGAPLNERY